MPSFADAAARLAGLTGVLLGWRPDDFWKATPAELAAVLCAMTAEAAEPLPQADMARLMEVFPDG